MARIKNQAGRNLLLAGGAGVLAVLLGRKAFARPKPRVFDTPTGCNPAPFVWRFEQVEAAVQTLVAQGETNEITIAVAVATQIYGTYPIGGAPVQYPPVQNAQAGVDCIWASVIAVVAMVMGDADIPTDGPNWPAIIDPLVEDPQNGGTPTPGKFFRIRPGWCFYGEVAKPAFCPGGSIIFQALQKAGVPSGPGHATNRLTYAAQILCSPWNDALLGLEGAKAAASLPSNQTDWKWRPYPPLAGHGRAIPNNAVHADNYTRMISGLPPRRSVRGVKSHDNTGGHLALVWLPLIEGGTNVPVVATHPDGSSGINPPKQVLSLGLENVFPGQYGCSPWREDAEPLQL